MRGWFFLLLLVCLGTCSPVLAQQETAPVSEQFEILNTVLPEVVSESAELFGSPEESTQALPEDLGVQPTAENLIVQPPSEDFSWPSCGSSTAQDYVQIEYLLWNLPGVDTPALLTSNPADTPLASIADPNDPSTQTVLGGSKLGDWAHSGIRLRYGSVILDGRLSRWELSGWSLFERSDNSFFSAEAGDPILARPVINTETGTNTGQFLNYTGRADGGSFRSEYDRSLFGIEPLAFFCVSCNGCASLETFTGYRYLHYKDEIRMTETVRPTASLAFPAGTQLLITDTFSASNDYHMIPLGLHYVRRNGGWRVSARGSVSIGFVSQEVDIRGRTTVTVLGIAGSGISTSGLLALPSNIGTHDRTEFAFVPELNLQLHRALGKGVWANVGCTLLYFNDVVRAPAHIDTTIDLAQLPPAPAIGTGTRPAFAWNSGGELLHGLNAGLEWHF